MVNNISNCGVIIFAAGRGTRMKSIIPKVLLPVGHKPIIHHAIEILQKTGFPEILIVVGYKYKRVLKSIRQIYSQKNIHFLRQRVLSGTGAALRIAYNKFPSYITNIMTINGDDSAFYKPSTLRGFLDLHIQSNKPITMLLAKVHQDYPGGRVYQDDKGYFHFCSYKTMLDLDIKSDLTHTGAYIFDRYWLEKNIHHLRRGKDGELPNYDLVYRVQEQHQTLPFMVIENGDEWMSVNNQNDLKMANRKMSILIESGNI